jgi:predicted aconitase
MKNMIETFVKSISASLPTYQDIEPDITLKITEKLFGPEDFSALGYYAGEKYKAKKLNFIFVSQPNKECITALSASLSIFNIPFTIGKKTENEIEIGFPEIDTIFRKFKSDLEPDLIWLGCPFASPEEIKKLSRMLQGREIKKDLQFLIFTKKEIQEDLEIDGYESEIEKSGAKLITEIEDLNFKCMLTNSEFFKPIILVI